MNDNTTDWLHIFTCGTIPQLKFIDGDWRVVDVTVTPERIKAIAENYDPEWRKSCVMIGHTNFDQPALAWIAALKVEGDMLFAKLEDSTPRMIEIVANKEYLYQSIGTDFFDRKGIELDYLDHLALTNFPLISGLQKLPEVYSGIAASKSSSQRFTAVTQKIDFNNFSNGISLKASSKNLTNNSMDKVISEAGKILAGWLGIQVTEYSTDEAVLTKASAIIQDLIAKFPEGTDQPKSLDLCVFACGKLVEDNTNLKASEAKLTKIYNDTIIASALASGVITEAEKETYEGLLADSPEKTLKLLTASKSTGIFSKNQISAAKIESISAEDLELKEGEDFGKLQKENPKKLEALQASKPDVFNKLWRDYYGEDYAG